MTRNFRAARVYHEAKRYVDMPTVSGRPPTIPPWLSALEKIPPSEALTRTYPVQHTQANPRARRPVDTFRPTRIEYPEDRLRRDFYRDHPWELARPRMVLELDGKDARYWDWSKGMVQPGLQLSGECVVQRQLWFMENEGLSKEEAYDKARREFYKLRQREEIEDRVAQEEARMVGAYFGMTALQVGMKVEDKEWENWKSWAAKQIAKMANERSQAYTSFINDDAADEGEVEGEVTA